MEKRLYRSRTDRKILGVCGGIGKFFDVDPTIIRLLWVIGFFAAGLGIFAYLITALIMPEEPDV